MSYLDDQNPNNLQGGANGQPPQRGGGGTFGGGGSTSQRPTQSGAFTNLQGYVNANQGQGANMVNQATQDTQNQYQGAVNAADSGYNNQISSMAPPRARSTFGAGEGGWNDYSTYMGQLSMPTSTDFTSSLSPSVSGVQAQGQAAQAGGDRWTQGLASGIGAQTGGNRNLNQAIMAIDPSARARSGELANQWSGIGGYISGKQNAANVATMGNAGAITAADVAQKQTGRQIGGLQENQASLNTNMGNVRSRLSQGVFNNPGEQQSLIAQLGNMQNIYNQNQQQLTGLYG